MTLVGSFRTRFTLSKAEMVSSAHRGGSEGRLVHLRRVE